jgi:2-oxoisovalerate dehydrogenase E2 component (dihydrolipoyl transacylase)
VRPHLPASPHRSAPAGTPGGETVPARGPGAALPSVWPCPTAGSRCHLHKWVDCTQLLTTRCRPAQATHDAGEPPAVTPFTLLCRLLVEAPRRLRVLNATFVEDGSRDHRDGACTSASPPPPSGGLVVAVARDAGRRSTLDLATEIARVADRGQAGTLPPTELIGRRSPCRTSVRSALDEGTPVINHPEAPIVGVGAVREGPVVLDGVVVARPRAALTLDFDHRVCDGAQAGAFLWHLRDLVERPESALLHS